MKIVGFKLLVFYFLYFYFKLYYKVRGPFAFLRYLYQKVKLLHTGPTFNIGLIFGHLSFTSEFGLKALDVQGNAASCDSGF